MWMGADELGNRARVCCLVQKLQQILDTEFCIGNFKWYWCWIMSFPKISMGNIGEQIQHYACWDSWLTSSNQIVMLDLQVFNIFFKSWLQITAHGSCYRWWLLQTVRNALVRLFPCEQRKLESIAHNNKPWLCLFLMPCQFDVYGHSEATLIIFKGIPFGSLSFNQTISIVARSLIHVHTGTHKQLM